MAKILLRLLCILTKSLSPQLLYGIRGSVCSHIYKGLGPQSHISFTSKKSFFPNPLDCPKVSQIVRTILVGFGWMTGGRDAVLCCMVDSCHLMH